MLLHPSSFAWGSSDALDKGEGCPSLCHSFRSLTAIGYPLKAGSTMLSPCRCCTSFAACHVAQEATKALGMNSVPDDILLSSMIEDATATYGLHGPFQETQGI